MVLPVTTGGWDSGRWFYLSFCLAPIIISLVSSTGLQQPVSTTLPLFPDNSKLWHKLNFLSFCRSSHLPLLAMSLLPFNFRYLRRFLSKIFRDHTWPWLRQVNHTCTLSLTTICLQVPILSTPFTGDPKSFFMSRVCNLLAGSSLPITLKLPGDNASGCELTLTF